MAVALVAVHYPRPDRNAEFVDRVQLVAELMRRVPGCRAAQCWVTAAGDAVVSIGEWDDGDARRASFAAARAGGVDFDDYDDEVQPRAIYWLATPGYDLTKTQPRPESLGTISG